MTVMPDYEARGLAQEALQRIEGHEKLCTERWTGAQKLLERLDKRWWWLLLAIIAGNIGTGFFVNKTVATNAPEPPARYGYDNPFLQRR